MRIKCRCHSQGGGAHNVSFPVSGELYCHPQDRRSVGDLPATGGKVRTDARGLYVAGHDGDGPFRPGQKAKIYVDCR